MYWGLCILDTCTNEVLLGENKEVLALNHYVYLNKLAVHLNVYIRDICRESCGV